MHFAKLNGATLKFGSLRGAILFRIDIRGADFEQTDLRGADLNLGFSEWDSATGFAGANVFGAIVHQEDLAQQIAEQSAVCIEDDSEWVAFRERDYLAHRRMSEEALGCIKSGRGD